MPYDCKMREKQTERAVISARSIFHKPNYMPEPTCIPDKTNGTWLNFLW